MTNFTHKCSKLVLGATIQVAAVALFLVVFGVSAVFAQTRAYVTNALDNTVSDLSRRSLDAFRSLRQQLDGKS